MPPRTVAAYVALRGATAARSRQRGHGRRRVADREVELDAQRAGAGVVQPELELGHHAEVPAAAAQPPEQLGVLVRRGAHDVAARGHDLARDQVVAGQAVLAGEPAHAATQGETADPGVRDVAGRRGQAVRLGGRVERPQQGAALHPRASALHVDAHRTHRRQVDHQPALGHRQPDHAVSTAADPDLQPLVAGLLRSRPRRRGAPGSGRPARDGGPPSRSTPPRLVVPLVACHQELRSPPWSLPRRLSLPWG